MNIDIITSILHTASFIEFLIKVEDLSRVIITIVTGRFYDFMKWYPYDNSYAENIRTKIIIGTWHPVQ